MNKPSIVLDVDRTELDSALKDAKKLAGEIKKCEKLLKELAERAANIKISVSQR